MLSGERTVALFCPACKQVQYYRFSLFAISDRSYPLQCECGFTQGHLLKNNQHYEIGLLCPSGDRVRLLYSLKEFWTAPLIAFYSPDKGEKLGFLGNQKQVEQAVFKLDDAFLEPDDFIKPEIMSEVLAYLHELAITNKIVCKCNKPSIGIDVYPNKVELVCSNCGSAMLMGAASKEDVVKLHNLSEIEMQPSSYTYLGEWLKPIR